VHNTFQVDQQRRIDAASWSRAWAAKAVRIESFVMSAIVGRAGLPSVTRDAIAAKSWR
jgi:hypothetical protein